MKNALIIGIIVVLFAGGYWFITQDQPTKEADVVTNTRTPTKADISETGNPTPFEENWETYTNTDYRISFPYPPEYEVTERPAAAASEYYVALQSPLDPNKPAKETTVGENELKIEIIIEESQNNDTTKRCVDGHLENATILSHDEVTIAQVDTTSYVWEGIGTGIFTCVIKNDYRYLINKYPYESSRDSYYENFVSALTLTE